MGLLALADSEGLVLPRPDAPAVPAGRCTSQSALVESVRHYDFFGARAQDAGLSLRERLLVTTDYQGREKRFTGQTDWHIEWRACFEPQGTRCRIGGVLSTVHVTYTLPRWADRDAAPAPLQDRWDRYLASLATHEKGHGAVAQDVAGLIEQALVGRVAEMGCEALHAQSTRIVDEVMQRGEALQRAYDRATDHGSTQGAQFPF